jgi:hypothetical protein
MNVKKKPVRAKNMTTCIFSSLFNNDDESAAASCYLKRDLEQG